MISLRKLLFEVLPVMNQFQTIVSSQRFAAAKKELLQVIAEGSAGLRSVRGPTADAKETYDQAVRGFAQDRGRDLYFPFLGSGLGSGPFVELADGSVKLDMITGIGINFFGH